MLDTTASSFVDTTILKPGKIYTYYVAGCYNNGSSNYLTMNSKSSTVVWGIPQLETDAPEMNEILVASMLGDGSVGVVALMSAILISVSILVAKMNSKKRKYPENLDVLVDTSGDKEPYIEGGEGALVDPWGNKYELKFKGNKKNSPYIVSGGPDGTIGTDDDIRSDETKK
jgi:hypothetical protein